VGLSKQRRISQWACRFSIEKLCRGVEKRELWDKPPADEAQVNLWTFTFPDAETRADPRKAMDRWPPVAKWLLLRGFRMVRVLEQGELGAWHIHGITPDFIPVKALRMVAEKAGFGRINVKRIPVEHAAYIAKYLAKQFMDKRMARIKKWGCIGFEGFTVPQIEMVEKTRILVPRCYDNHLWTRILWVWPDKTVHVARIREANSDGSETDKIMNIKPHWMPVIERELSSGASILLGEYRGCEAVTKQVNAYEGGKIVGKVSRVVVTHFVEDTNGKGHEYRERLPDPSNRPDGTVLKAGELKAPASRGDMVLVRVTNMSRQFGDDTDGIICLSNVGEKKS